MRIAEAARQRSRGQEGRLTYVVPQNPSSVAVAEFMLSRLALVADVPSWSYAESVTGAIYNDKVTSVEHYNAGVIFLDRLGLKS
ncbi:hypothetical protein [Streptodolium elevatio]|uniref:Uncharacterized protein n=1 Tax=Streptodolium elevatio TaxID=3157996 RepID=A0ABV3DTN4_9ACTN